MALTQVEEAKGYDLDVIPVRVHLEQHCRKFCVCVKSNDENMVSRCDLKLAQHYVMFQIEI